MKQSTPEVALTYVISWTASRHAETENSAQSGAGPASLALGNGVFDPDRAHGCLHALVPPFDSYNKNPSPVSL